MTKTTLAVLLALTGGAALAADQTNTITFTGEVTDSTCKVRVNNQDNPVVPLPTVPATQLTDGNTAGLTPFELHLTDCTAMQDDKTVTIDFIGHGVTTAGNLQNIATDKAASHVVLQLTEDAGGTKPISLAKGAVAGVKLVVPKGKTGASHTYAVQYLAEGGDAKAGAVKGVVQYRVSYL